MRKTKLPKGIHRVRRRVAGGVKYHFYAWRGGPKFWEDQVPFPSDVNFFHAYSKCAAPLRSDVLLTERLVDDFLSSAAMPKAQRSKADIRLWLGRFRDEFGADPAALFEERGARSEVNTWRKCWIHSPKQHDMAGTHAARLLNWAVKEGRIREHHCHGLEKLYRPNRTEIIWTSSDIELFGAHAPDWVRRILIVGCETGLRVADLVEIRMDQFEATANGQRLRFQTSKRGQVAFIPVTQALADLIAETPQSRDRLLVTELGKPLKPRWASNQITNWRRIAKVPPWEDGREKTLADTRGTAATRLLNADLSLRQIATLMGWSVRYAAQVIELYARVSPDESDAVLAKLEEARSRERSQKM